MAREWFEIWSLTRGRRMEERQWSSQSPLMDMDDLRPCLPIFRLIAQRNLGRARRRYLRARGNMIDNGDVAFGDGSVLPEPSDDEPIPVEPDGLPRTLPPPFNELQGSDDPRFAVQF